LAGGFVAIFIESALELLVDSASLLHHRHNVAALEESMAPARYYSEDDIEAGVSPSQLKRLGRAKQIEYMLYWFKQYYEDPSNDTPYESQEGGFQYIWGGPYDASDVLFNEFGHLVREESILEAASLLTQEGTFDWAPSSRHPNRGITPEDNPFGVDSFEDLEPPSELEAAEDALRHIEEALDRGAIPLYGGAAELALRQAILLRIANLYDALPLTTPAFGGIGHNNPPDDSANGELDIGLRAAQNIGAELRLPAPDAKSVAKSTSILLSITKWVGAKLDIAFDAFAKSIGDAAGKATIIGVGLSLSPQIKALIANSFSEIVTLTAKWLGSITAMF
jgi:hypothetical protein